MHQLDNAHTNVETAFSTSDFTYSDADSDAFSGTRGVRV